MTGSYEPPRPNPLENMTEEQKEYEAVKLVNMIDRLQKYVLFWLLLYFMFLFSLLDFIRFFVFILGSGF